MNIRAHLAPQVNSSAMPGGNPLSLAGTTSPDASSGFAELMSMLLSLQGSAPQVSDSNGTNLKIPSAHDAQANTGDSTKTTSSANVDPPQIAIANPGRKNPQQNLIPVSLSISLPVNPESVMEEIKPVPSQSGIHDVSAVSNPTDDKKQINSTELKAAIQNSQSVSQDAANQSVAVPESQTEPVNAGLSFTKASANPMPVPTPSDNSSQETVSSQVQTLKTDLENLLAQFKASRLSDPASVKSTESVAENSVHVDGAASQVMNVQGKAVEFPHSPAAVEKETFQLTDKSGVDLQSADQSVRIAPQTETIQAASKVYSSYASPRPPALSPSQSQPNTDAAVKPLQQGTAPSSKEIAPAASNEHHASDSTGDENHSDQEPAPQARRTAVETYQPLGVDPKVDSTFSRSLSDAAPTSTQVDSKFDPAQVAQSIVRQIKVMTQEGKTVVNLKLEPESLGSVILKISSDSGKISADFDVKTPDARAYLEASVPQLRESLQSNGVSLSHLTVNLSGGESSTRHPQYPAQKQPQKNYQETEDLPDESARNFGYNTMEVRV